MPPTVSVIIPAYNQVQFVSQAIESVLAQTFTDYEIIVINDGSTDKTAEVLANYEKHIRLITQTNAGLSAARNSGLAIACGEMIGFLDADDLWYPGMLSTMVAHLKRNPHIDLVCGAWDVIDEKGRIITPLNKPSNFKAKVQVDFLRAVATGNLFLVHALLIRHKCFKCCGAFDPNLRAVEDWDMWIRLAAHGHKADLIDVPVARYRRHNGNMTYEPHRMEQASTQLLTKLFSNQQLAPRVADLQDHAYIGSWLTIAGFCHTAGLEAETRRYVKMAYELYLKAPKNTEQSLHHFNRLLVLPETEAFMRLIVAATPKVLIRYYLLKGYQVLRRGHYSLILSRLKWSNLRALGLGAKDAFSKRPGNQKP